MTTAVPWWTDSTKPARTTCATIGAAASAALTDVDAVTGDGATVIGHDPQYAGATRQGRHPGWGDGPAVRARTAGARLSWSRSVVLVVLAVVLFVAALFAGADFLAAVLASRSWSAAVVLAAVFEAVFLTALLAGAALRATVALGSSVVAELRAATLRVVLASTSLSLRVAAAFCAADLRIACWCAAVRSAGTGAAADSTASTEAPTCEPIFEASLATTSMRLLATFSPSVTAVSATRRPRVTVAVPRSAEVERGALALGAQVGDDLLAAGCGGVVLVLGVARDDEALVEDAGREVLGLRDEALGIRRRELLELGGAALEVDDALLEVLLQLVRLLLGTLAQVDALGLSAGDLELLAGGADRVDRDVRGADDGVERRRVDLDVGHAALDLDELAAHVGDGGLGLLLGVLDGLGDLLGECHLSSPSR